METILQVLDCDYVNVNNKPLVRIFGRTQNGESITVFYEKYKPYFYILPSDKEVIISELKEKFPSLVEKIEDVEKFLPIGYAKEKTKLLKVTLTDPSQTPVVRDSIKILPSVERIFEADILFKYRFMADFGIYGMKWIKVKGEPVRTSLVKTGRTIKAEEIEPAEILENTGLKHLSLDIEVASAEGGMPNPKKDPIIMVALSFSPSYNNTETLVRVSKRRGLQNHNTLEFDDEKAMMQRLLDIIDKYDPDIITGYNINSFDLPYINDRLYALKLPKTMGRCNQKPLNSRKMRENKFLNQIPGRVIVDPYTIIREMATRGFFVGLKRFGLNDVSLHILGEGKMEMTKSQIPEYWKGKPEDVRKLVEYARKDAVLALRILLEKQLIDKYIGVSMVSGVLLQDSLDSGEAVKVDNILLRKFNKEGFVIPNKPDEEEVGRRDRERITKKLEGGFVLEPVTGLHSNAVVLLDFASMYPSIFIGYNICPTTLVTDSSLVDDITETPYGTRFVSPKVREGIIPRIVKELIEERAKVKKEMRQEKDESRLRTLDSKQEALKRMSNAFYGYTGFIMARLYVLDIASAITSCGRNYIHKTTEAVEGNTPHKVIYGDSMTADRFVTVLDPDNTIRIKNVEELFEENKHRLVHTHDKEAVLLEGYRALATDPANTRPAWSPIKLLIRHKTGKKIYRVSEKFGETVVTEDHSLIVNEGGRLVEAKPLNMQGRHLFRVEGVPAVENTDVIDLYKFLKPFHFTQIYKKLEKTTVLEADDSSIWAGWMKMKRPIKLKRFIQVRSREFESLCRLLGAYIAEGSSSTGHTTSRWGASIACTDTAWLNQLREDFLNLFYGTSASVIQSNVGMRELSYQTQSGQQRTVVYEDTTHKLQMMNKLAAIFFKMLCGQKSMGKKLPEFIFHVPNKYKLILLENFIKGDGSRWADSRYSEEYIKNNFRLETKSHQLACGLSLLLNQLGIRYTIRRRDKKNTYVITTCTYFNSRETLKVKEENYEGYVYDLSVDGTNTFVDSCGQILLHNTDSIMIETNTKDLDKALEMGDGVAKIVNDEFKGKMRIKVENVFRTLLILSKKRYVGWNFEKQDGIWKEKMVMKGIETVRRDWCNLVSEVLNEILNIVLREQNPQKALDYMKDIVHKLQDNKIELDKLVITKGISKRLEEYKGTQPHVELVKKMRKREGASPYVGDRVGFVIVKGLQNISDRAEDPEYIKKNNLKIDPKYYIENQLLPPLERVFEAMGLDKSELFRVGKQMLISDILNNSRKKDNGNSRLTSADGLICDRCSKTYDYVPLVGKCIHCGGEMMFYSGDVKSKILHVESSLSRLLEKRGV